MVCLRGVLRALSTSKMKVFAKIVNAYKESHNSIIGKHYGSRLENKKRHGTYIEKWDFCCGAVV